MTDTTQQTQAEPEGTFEQRVHALTEATRDEDHAVSAERLAEDLATPAPAPVEDPAARAREERQVRLAMLRHEADAERQRVDRKAPIAEQDQAMRRAEEAERRIKEMEAQLAGRVDPATLDEASFFQLASRAGVSPQKLGEWIRDSMTNPERMATEAATKALSPQMREVAERAERAERQVQEFIQQQQRAQAEAAEAQAAQRFVSSITPESAPRAAAFLGAFGHSEFLKIAHSAAASLPAGAGQQALLDEIEETLDRLASAFSPPSNGQRTQTPNRGAAKPTTVSNSVAQQRASVVEEDDFASLPFEERVRRIRSSA